MSNPISKTRGILYGAARALGWIAIIADLLSGHGKRPGKRLITKRLEEKSAARFISAKEARHEHDPNLRQTGDPRTSGGRSPGMPEIIGHYILDNRKLNLVYQAAKVAVVNPTKANMKALAYVIEASEGWPE